MDYEALIDRLKSLSFRASMYIVIGLSLLSVSALGLYGIHELRDRHHLLDVVSKVAGVQSDFQEQVAQGLENRGIEAYERNAEQTILKLQVLGVVIRALNLRDANGAPLADRVSGIEERYAGLSHDGHTAANWDGEKFFKETQAINAILRDLREQVVNACTDRTLIDNRIFMLYVLAVMVLLPTISLLLLRQFLLPLDLLVATARKIGDGDLTQRVDLDLDTELGQLGITINEMSAGLGMVAKRINGAIGDLAGMAEEMNQSVTRQSAGASEQAAAVLEVTATLEQIRTNSEGTLVEAEALRERAEEISMEGERGRQSVERAAGAMGEISARMDDIAESISRLDEHSAQIGTITDTVRNLSRQSKMLSLNAAIEAAKAGEAGQGFGVVAAEVRHLSEQSERATEQVAEILEQIRKATERAVRAAEEGAAKVTEGRTMVDSSGQVVGELGRLVQGTTQTSRRIAGAMREEALGIQQATDAMNDISRVISEFVDDAKQNEQATERLNDLIQRIKKTVSRYRIK